MDGTTTNPTLQDYLTLFIDFGFSTAQTLTTAFLAFVPTIIQAVINLIFGAFYAANPTT